VASITDSSTILGVDPGLQNTGWAVLSKNANTYKFFESGTIKTKADEPLQLRLRQINSELSKVIEKYDITEGL
jgi:crossover junction endodeoxyribonuclease RuvC